MSGCPPTHHTRMTSYRPQSNKHDPQKAKVIHNLGMTCSLASHSCLPTTVPPQACYYLLLEDFRSRPVRQETHNLLQMPARQMGGTRLCSSLRSELVLHISAIKSQKSSCSHFVSARCNTVQHPAFQGPQKLCHSIHVPSSAAQPNAPTTATLLPMNELPVVNAATLLMHSSHCARLPQSQPCTPCSRLGFLCSRVSPMPYS